MTKRDAVLNEVGKVPDEYLEEVLDFIRFLRQRLVRETNSAAVASKSALTKDWLRPEEDEAWKDL